MVQLLEGNASIIIFSIRVAVCCSSSDMTPWHLKYSTHYMSNGTYSILYISIAACVVPVASLKYLPVPLYRERGYDRVNSW